VEGWCVFWVEESYVEKIPSFGYQVSGVEALLDAKKCYIVGTGLVKTFCYFASICAIAKDEPDIIDWVNYHFAIGFDKIWIFDNDSKFRIKDQLEDYVRLGIVDVIDFKFRDSQQLSAYATFLSQYGNQTRWAAFIDIDEYINLKRHTDISDFLENYSEHPAVGISWKIFGSNGHIHRTRKSVLEAYTTCLQEHSLIKSVIQPSMTSRVSSPHHFIYKDGLLGVNEHFIPILGPRSYHTSENIQINHYYFKSQQDFEAKISRGFATPVLNRDSYKMHEFYKQAGNPGEPEVSILRFLKKANAYSRLGSEFIAQEINDRTCFNINDVLENASKAILHKSEAHAIRLLKKALKYSEDPLLYISLSKIYSLQNDFDNAFKCLSKGFIAAGTDTVKRDELYKELALSYKRKGFTKQQNHILQELER
jgi:tetratricopeptide (TPR) repeat protein